MKISDLPAYKRIEEKFLDGTFTDGNKINLPIYSFQTIHSRNLTPGHFVDALNYCKLTFADVPEKYRTREFFIHALSSTKKDLVAYVKAHLGNPFDKQFFKDHIVTEHYALEFDNNCFEYMPLEYIDEEMVSCAIMQSVRGRYVERRGDFDDWFYSVARRKPEVLTQDFWTLGARLFAAKWHSKNKFLEITPEKYRTQEYYFAMCLENNTPVMEDFPEEILTTAFLISVINDNASNIKSFSETSLEKVAPMKGHDEPVKFWQAAYLLDGYLGRYIPLNEERVNFYLSHYDKDSHEYKFGFKDTYKSWQKKQNNVPTEQNSQEQLTRAASMTLLGALMGVGTDAAIDIADVDLKNNLDKSSLLPIRNRVIVPDEYSKKFDQEEYLLEIYKKLGITVVNEYDTYYYQVILPDGYAIEPSEDSRFSVLTAPDKKYILKYIDVGPFYDRDVYVSDLFVTL